MPYLTLNGITIPVVRCEETRSTPGTVSRVHSGTCNVSRRLNKREWKCLTPPVRGSQAATIKGLIRGLGNCWRFDDQTLYDAKGHCLDLAGSDFDTVADLTTATGNVVEEEVVSGVIQYGRGTLSPSVEARRYSASVPNATTNELDSATRKIQSGSASSFTAVDSATVSVVDTKSWAGGGYALKVVTSGSVNSVKGGVYNSTAASIGSGNYAVGSIYLLSDEALAADRTLEIYLYDITNAASSTVVTIELEQSKWTRVHIPAYKPGSGAFTCRLYIKEATEDSGLTFYADGLQIEEKATETGSSAWYDGIRATAGVISSDALGFLGGAGDCTIFAWCSNPPIATADSDRYLFCMRATASGNNPLVRLRRLASNGYVRMDVIDENGTETTVTGSVDFNSGDSHHAGQMIMLAGVVRRAPGSGESNVELYAAGSLVDSANATMPDLSEIAGTNGEGGWGCYPPNLYPWVGTIDDLTVLPYAMDAVSIAALATRGRFSSLPEYLAEGDFCIDSAVRVVSEIGACSAAPIRQSGAWGNDAQAIAFTLHEV